MLASMANAPLRLTLLCALLSACPGRGLDDVARARTPAEERAAFAALASRGGVSFVAYDADGRQLDLGVPRWWEKARRLRLGAGGASIDHVLIDPANVIALMNE